MNRNAPGRIERKLLEGILKLLAPERAAEVAGDIEEAFRKRSAHHGFIHLRLWFWWQVVALALWLAPSRFRSGRRDSGHHERKRRETMRGTWNDLRFALRSFRRAPGFTAAVILTLALGVGANTAIFTVVNAILWRPLDIPDAARVVGVCERGGSTPSDFCGASPPNMTDWQATATTLEGFGIARTRTLLRTEETGITGVNAGIGTPGFLTTLGARPLLGRLLDEGDLLPNDHHVIVLSYEYWITEFGGDSSLVGRPLIFDEQPYQVVGVLSPDVDLPLLGWARLWTPMPWDPADEANRGWRGFWSVARLRDGVDLDEAQAEMETIADRLAGAYPDVNRGQTVQIITLRDQLVEPVRGQLLVFLGASAFVLLIACVNVANLLLARASDRQTEFAVRASLGAGRTRLTRQLLTESLALASAGGLVGFWLGHFAVRWFVTLAPPGIPRMDEVRLDATVAAFGAAVLVATAVVFGLAPARRATRVDLTSAIKQGGGGGRMSPARTGARDALAVAEISLAAMLLIGAGLLIRSFSTAARWDPGFDPENLSVAWLLGSSAKYQRGGDVVRTFHRVAEEVRSLPQVRSATTASAGPLFGGNESSEFTVAGREDPGPNHRPNLRWFDVGPDFFSTIGIGVVRGRSFDASDDEGAPPVAVINEAAARVLFAGEDPLGQRIVDEDYLRTATEVIGVVQDVRPVDPLGAAEPVVYWPNLQRPRWATYLVMRTTIAPEGVFEAARSRVVAVDPSMNVTRPTTIENAMAAQLVRPRFHMLLIASFAFVALALAAVGTYGVIAYGVSQRTHEFGLRMSLGADNGTIMRLVLQQGVRLGAVGLALGLTAAFALSRVMSSMLVGVTSRDPMTFAVGAVMLGIIVMLASSVPAIRAARTDPMTAIRSE